jgi:hypothetical protein
MNEKARTAIPIARKQGLVIQELPDEVLVYDLDRDRAHCLNQTAAFVWQHCNGKNNAAQIARSLGQQFDCAVDEKVVWLALDQLGTRHLLDRKPVPPASLLGMNRRAMVRALGLAAVVGIPVVTSIVAPTPTQAASCVPAGGSCTLAAECCAAAPFCNGGMCSATNP